MVNRVFCFSKDVAKQNGNKLPILQLIFSTIFFIFAFIVLAVVSDSAALFAIMMIAFIVVIVYYSVILGLRMRTRMSGWATTTDGRIFKAVAMNNGQGLYFGGLAAGSLIDQVAGSSNNIGRDAGGALGAAAQFYSMNRSAQYMSHPEIIAKMVEDAPNITGAEVFEILGVHSITNNSHSVKINCDYRIVRTGKIKYNKNMSIEKSFNQMDDLVNTLNTHRG